MSDRTPEGRLKLCDCANGEVPHPTIPGATTNCPKCDGATHEELLEREVQKLRRFVEWVAERMIDIRFTSLATKDRCMCRAIGLDGTGIGDTPADALLALFEEVCGDGEKGTA